MRKYPKRTALAVYCAMAVLTVGGCGFDPASVPVPGTTVSGQTYPLHIEFADVLNLPRGAKVIADGVTVGNLSGLRIVETSTAEGKPARGFVIADIEVMESVRLPGDVIAELRSATPLGDVHIALTSPSGSSVAPLTSGATIAVAQTRKSPQPEDTMAGLATALGSGAVTDIQDTVRQLNSTLPRDPRQTAQIFGVLGTDLTDVAGDLGSLDALLDALTATTGTVTEYLPVLEPMLTDDGVRHLVASTNSVINVFFIFTNLAPVARNAVWLAPLVSAADAAAAAYVPMLFGYRPLDLGSPSNMAMLVDFIQNKLIPFAEHGPKVNLTGISASGPEAVPAADQTGRIIDTLRMIGAVR